MPKAKYQDIYKDLKERIQQGQYKFMDLLPSEITLTEEFGCTRNTARRALSELAQEGYLQSIKGKGVQVIYKPSTRTRFYIGGVETFKETAKRNNFEVQTKVVEFKELEINKELAELTGFPGGEEAYFVKRVRYLNGKPLILDVSYFLKKPLLGLCREIAEDSIYEFIEKKKNMRISLTKRSLTVEPATEEDKCLLELNDCNCVACVANLVFSSTGICFEWTISRHTPNCFQFDTIATRSVDKNCK